MSETLSIDPARSALLLMDFQNDIAAKGGKMAPSEDEALARFADAMEVAHGAADTARKAKLPVFHIAVGRPSGAPPHNPHAPMFQFMAGQDALAEGSAGFDFHPGMEPAPGDRLIVKRGISAFAGTELGPTLQGMGVDTVVLCGFVTHWVVEGTARDAADRGYRVIVLEDGCASGGQDKHRAALENIAFIGTVVSGSAFAAALS